MQKDGLKICVTNTGIKSIIKRKNNRKEKKRKSKNDTIILLSKPKLNSIELLISKKLINTN